MDDQLFTFNMDRYGQKDGCTSGGTCQSINEDGNQVQEQNNLRSTESTQEVQLKPLASSDLLRHRMQELVSEINSKRQRDNALLQEFKSCVHLQADEVYNNVEAAVFGTCDRTTGIFQKKIHELMQVLQRIATLEAELAEFKRALGLFYNDLQSESLDPPTQSMQ